MSLQIALHDEAQRGKLAGAVADRVGHFGSGVAEKQRLEASEHTADSKVDFLPRVRCFGLVLIGRSQRADRVPNIGGDER